MAELTSQQKVAQYEKFYAGTYATGGAPVERPEIKITPSGETITYATPSEAKVLGVEPVQAGERYVEIKTQAGKTVRIPESQFTPQMRAQAEETGTVFGTRFSGYETYHPAPVMQQGEGVYYSPEGAQRAGFISRQQAAEYEKAGTGRVFIPQASILAGRQLEQYYGAEYEKMRTQYGEPRADVSKMEALYSFAKEQYEKTEAPIQERITALQKIAKEDPARYLGLYYTSAWGSGIISAAGIAGRTIGQPIESWIKGEPIGEAGKRELREFAIRTLEFEKEPVKTIGLGMLQAPLIAGSSYVFGVLGAKAALYSDIAGKAFSIGTKAAFAGLTVAHVAPSFLEGKYAETVGKGAEILGTIGLGYEPFKAGVKKQLEISYAKEYGIPSEALKLAGKAGELAKIKVRPYEEVLKEMPLMKKGGARLRETTLDVLYAQRGKIIIGGSSAARAQVLGKIPKDIDIYAKSVSQFKRVALGAYREADLDVTAKGSSLFFKGEKLFDIHTIEFLTQKTFYKGEVTSPEGLRLMDVRGQLFRKVAAAYEEPSSFRVLKDIPDFEKMVKSVISTGTLEAEKSLPILKQFKEAKVTSTKKALQSFIESTKGYATYEKPSVAMMPLLPVFIPSYKKSEKAREAPIRYIASEAFKDYGTTPAKPTITYTAIKTPSKYEPPSALKTTAYAPTKPYVFEKAPTYTYTPIKTTTYLPPYIPTKITPITPYPPYYPPKEKYKFEQKLKSEKGKRYTYKLNVKTGRVGTGLLSDILSVTGTQAKLLTLGKSPLALHPRSYRVKYREFERSAGLRIPTAQMLRVGGFGKIGRVRFGRSKLNVRFSGSKSLKLKGFKSGKGKSRKWF